jgi:lipoprotein-releasing system ATP-binding protein
VTERSSPSSGASREDTRAKGGGSAESALPQVRVENLTKVFDHGGRRLEVLRGIQLTLQEGEILSVVGKSGAGKSTLLHVLGTIDHPTSGRIFFAGQDLQALSSAQLAEFRNRFIGFVFQFHHLLPEFTALENVMIPGLIQRLSRREATDRARAILVAVGLEDRLTHRPGELSGGEQQRVALARALVLQPKLLLADEPTGNLDSKTGESVHELFLELNAKLRTTMLIVTHNNDLADRLPRRLVMVDGVLYEKDARPDPATAATGGEA